MVNDELVHLIISSSVIKKNTGRHLTYKLLFVALLEQRHNKRHTTSWRDIQNDARQCNTTHDNAIRHLMFSGKCHSLQEIVNATFLLSNVAFCFASLRRIICRQNIVSRFVCRSCIMLHPQSTTYYTLRWSYPDSVYSRLAIFWVRTTRCCFRLSHVTWTCRVSFCLSFRMSCVALKLQHMSF